MIGAKVMRCRCYNGIFGVNGGIWDIECEKWWRGTMYLRRWSGRGV